MERNKRRMEFAAEMEADCFMFMNGPKPEGHSVTLDDIKAAAEGAEAWAEYAAQFGLELSYHIHTNLLVDSSEDWRAYMGLLDKAKLCIDVSHAQLWGYDPVESIRDFRSQLNYIHLQDYSSTSRREDGYYLPVWCDVGQAASVDFPAVRGALQEIGYTRWVTACPGQPIPGADDPISEARRSKGMVDYLRGIGY
jgi:sugar phosphate isomerase/epimerase